MITVPCPLPQGCSKVLPFPASSAQIRSSKSEIRNPKGVLAAGPFRISGFGFPSVFGQILTDFPGRAGGCPPAPPQSRTSPIEAYGSSAHGLAL